MTDKQVINTRKWIEALLSKKYKRGRRVLYKDGRYCALGLAPLILGAERRKSGFFIRDKVQRIYLPNDYAQINFGKWLTARVQAYITLENDASTTFPNIARWISKQSGVPLPESKGE